MCAFNGPVHAFSFFVGVRPCMNYEGDCLLSLPPCCISRFCHLPLADSCQEFVFPGSLHKHSCISQNLPPCDSFVAHANGAFLTYLGGLQAGAESSGKDAADDKSLLDNFTKLMNHLIFTGLEKKP